VKEGEEAKEGEEGKDGDDITPEKRKIEEA
jgi:hypothetical protein